METKKINFYQVYYLKVSLILLTRSPKPEAGLDPVKEQDGGYCFSE
jgi:hypothetical protein